jgi:hypothetical protein
LFVSLVYRWETLVRERALLKRGVSHARLVQQFNVFDHMPLRCEVAEEALAGTETDTASEEEEEAGVGWGGGGGVVGAAHVKPLEPYAVLPKLASDYVGQRYEV